MADTELSLLPNELITAPAEADAIYIIVGGVSHRVRIDNLLSDLEASRGSPVSVPEGGTGVETISTGEVLIGAGTGAVTSTALGITDNDILEVDGDPNLAEWAIFTANGLAGKTDAELIADLSLEINVDILAQQTIGIADNNLLEVDGSPSDTEVAVFTADGLNGRPVGISDNNLLEVDDAAAASAQYARFTANGLEGRSVAEAQGDLDIVGLQTIWIPAAAIRPATAFGCAAITGIATTPDQPDMIVLDFDTTTEERAQFSIAMPKRWNLGDISFQVFWTRSVTPTNFGVMWGLQAVAVTADGSIDVAYSTHELIGIDAAQSNEDLWVSAISANFTINGSPADDDLCFFQISRVTGDAADDMEEDARLIGIKIFWTSDEGVDS